MNSGYLAPPAQRTDHRTRWFPTGFCFLLTKSPFTPCGRFPEFSGCGCGQLSPSLLPASDSGALLKKFLISYSQMHPFSHHGKCFCVLFNDAFSPPCLPVISHSRFCFAFHTIYSSCGNAIYAGDWIPGAPLRRPCQRWGASQVPHALWLHVCCACCPGTGPFPCLCSFRAVLHFQARTRPSLGL